MFICYRRHSNPWLRLVTHCWFVRQCVSKQLVCSCSINYRFSWFLSPQRAEKVYDLRKSVTHITATTFPQIFPLRHGTTFKEWWPDPSQGSAYNGSYWLYENNRPYFLGFWFEFAPCATFLPKIFSLLPIYKRSQSWRAFVSLFLFLNKVRFWPISSLKSSSEGYLRKYITSKFRSFPKLK